MDGWNENWREREREERGPEEGGKWLDRKSNQMNAFRGMGDRDHALFCLPSDLHDIQGIPMRTSAKTLTHPPQIYIYTHNTKSVSVYEKNLISLHLLISKVVSFQYRFCYLILYSFSISLY